MRFRRRTKLFPGVYLNFSKSGISTTIGMRGASINLNKQGTFLNTGIPGTGLYNRQKIGGGKKANQNIANETSVENKPIKNIGVIKSEQAETTTTEDLQELKKTLLDCYQERVTLKNEIIKNKQKLIFATIIQIVSQVLIFGFFVKWFKENSAQIKEYLTELNNQLKNCFVDIDMSLDSEIEKCYEQLLENYKQLLICEKIWDITSSVAVNRKTTRSAASASLTRTQVKFRFNNIDIIKSKYDALHFENANGGDLYIYPAFIAIVDAQKKFGLIDIRELHFCFREQRFLEEEGIPKDSQVVGYTWTKVNKNGTPDKRFKNNHQIPICLYGEFSLTSNTGLNEAYSLSSCEKSKKFACSMTNYQSAIK